MAQTIKVLTLKVINLFCILNEITIFFSLLQIGSIESNGIVLKAQNFSILKSAFGEMSSNAININSSEIVLVKESDFGSDLPPDAINISATVLDIRSNTFKLLPTGIFTGKVKYEDNRKIIFTNNTIYNIQLEESLYSISSLFQRAEISGNRFPCTCFLHGFHTFLPDLGQNNFCIASNCNVTLSYFSDLIEGKKVCTSSNSEDPDEYEICADVPRLTPHSPRGRELRTTQTPSAMTTTTITNGLRNSSDSITFVPVILFCALFTVIFKF
jgi:hypothetical protein